jgi:energy-coupling factor transporter ATP-binding protein EcfA2
MIHLTKRYGATTAVDSIDLKVPAGAYCCLLGPSGCGKTSTLRMIAGHESATEGDILIGPTNVTELPPAKRGTAMMFQSYALFPHLSCVCRQGRRGAPQRAPIPACGRQCGDPSRRHTPDYRRAQPHRGYPERTLRWVRIDLRRFTG